MATEKERRQLPRININWPVTIYIGNDRMDGEIKNISSEGLHICCENPLPLEKVFRISINPPDYQSVGMTGKVVWSNMYGMKGEKDVYGMGVCLVKISKEGKIQIKEILSKYVNSRQI